MRFAVSETIYEAAVKDKKIYFLTGDTGHAKEADFKKNIPRQYMNTGMAEQNMVGMGAGLALSGMKSFVYGIVPFLILRAFEQIKVDVCYQNVDVTMIGVGSGLAYGVAGGTHYSIEDIAALRALPNMKIVVPATPHEARALTTQIIAMGGPAYIRIGRGAEPDFPNPEPSVEFGKAMVMKQGKDATIFASGTILFEALRAAELLENDGIDLEVINVHTLKPFDHDTLLARVKENKHMFTLEEHNIYGGLGSIVSEIIAEQGNYKGTFKRFGIRDAWPKFVGSQQFLREALGISAEKVREGVLKSLA